MMITIARGLRCCFSQTKCLGDRSLIGRRSISRTRVNQIFDARDKSQEKQSQELIVQKSLYFDEVTGEIKTKEAFHEAINLYLKRNAANRRGHVEFVYAALEKTEEFQAHRDVETYKAILRIFPKHKMKPQTALQVDFMHYPKQQQCCIDLLCHMERHGVVPDDELGYQLVDLFGDKVHAFRKYQRMMYWMPKFKYADPYYVPYELPEDRVELAKIALDRIKVDLENEITVYDTKDLENAVDKTFVVSAQSPNQRRLLSELPRDQTLYVEGPHLTWMRTKSYNLFVLKSFSTANYDNYVENLKKFDYKNVDSEEDMTLFKYDCDPREVMSLSRRPTPHEQEDGVVLATCVTGTSSKDSINSWIKFLEGSNPSLGSTPVLFLIKSPLGEVVPADEKKE